MGLVVRDDILRDSDPFSGIQILAEATRVYQKFKVIAVGLARNESQEVLGNPYVPDKESLKVMTLQETAHSKISTSNIEMK